MRRVHWYWVLLLCTILSYWKIIFTRQYSLLLDYESANQTYAWYHFAASSLQRGEVPLWDPYTHAGRPFAGEMQTGLFYPPKILLYFWPFNRSNQLSPQLVHYYIVLTHFAAAAMMFRLGRELGLGPFAALVSGICFGLGGFVGRVPWPYMLDAAIWLPAAVLFEIRALRAATTVAALRCAAGCGLALAMAVLAGSLHVAMMDAIVVAGLGAWRAVARPERRARSALVVTVAGLIAFTAGAVQLLPSLEYSSHALRHLGGDQTLPAREKIPYAALSDSYWPRALMGLVLGSPFPGGSIGSAEVTPYFGVLPFVLALVGVWCNWRRPTVRYLVTLAGAGLFYTFGGFSLLHGLAYALLPYLWMAREAGRFVYVVHFALALLAGYGAHTLLAGRGLPQESLPLGSALKWTAAGSLAALGVPALYGKPEMNEWAYVFLLFLLAACGVMLALLRGQRGAGVQLLVAAVILSDLAALHWNIRNRAEERQTGRDHLTVLMNFGKLAEFFQSRPGPFRVHFVAPFQPNTGDLHGVPETGGMSATVLRNYDTFLRRAPRALDLLNVRYIIRPAAETAAGAVLDDGVWKVYENATALPRAWIVSEVVNEPSLVRTFARMADPAWDPATTAFVARDAGSRGSGGAARIERYENNRLDVRAWTASGGLLVLSEIDYPGWWATVNGAATKIERVNGLLRGVVVPRGESRVRLEYSPRSVRAGAALTLATCSGVLAWFAAARFRRQKGRPWRRAPQPYRAAEHPARTAREPLFPTPTSG